MLVLTLLLSACAPGGDDTATLLDEGVAPMADAPVAQVDLNGIWIGPGGVRSEIHQNGDFVWVRLHALTFGLGHFVGPRGITIGFPDACCNGFLPEGEDDWIYWSNGTEWRRE